MSKEYILAIDQGTTQTTVLLVHKERGICGKVAVEIPQIYPYSGWVEHDPEAIWSSVIRGISRVLEEKKVSSSEIRGIGITNQRETTILWDRKTLVPLHNAIVWQCRRTASMCAELKSSGVSELFQKRTGLVLDPYFSGTKVKWLLDHLSGVRKRATKGEIAFGTIDTFLVSRLTGGRCFVTDPSNASRTLMMNLASLNWDPTLLEILDIPYEILPEIRSSSEIYGYTSGVPGLLDGIPIASMIGDQQAALFGQLCTEEGDIKCTYGTGAFLLMNIGKIPLYSQAGLITTVAWKREEETFYALEGSVFIAGAACQWLRDGLRLIDSVQDIEELARRASFDQRLIFVPALTGLGAPHWKPNIKGLLYGITRNTKKEDLALATLQGIALQIYDLVQTMKKEAQKKLKSFKVDGGAATNNLLMQIQADLLEIEIIRPTQIETTALGSAYLAGLTLGLWQKLEDIKERYQIQTKFIPKMDTIKRKQLLKEWNRILECAKHME